MNRHRLVLHSQCIHVFYLDRGPRKYTNWLAGSYVRDCTKAKDKSSWQPKVRRKLFTWRYYRSTTANINLIPDSAIWSYLTFAQLLHQHVCAHGCLGEARSALLRVQMLRLGACAHSIFPSLSDSPCFDATNKDYSP